MTVSLNTPRDEILSPSQMRKKIDLLNEKAWQLDGVDPNKGLRLSREAYQLSREGIFQITVYQKGVADSLFNQSHFNLSRGDYQLSLSQALDTLNQYSDLKDSVRQVQTLRNMGAIYLVLNEFNNAMSSLLKSLDIARTLTNQLPFGETTLTIGKAYLAAGENEQALIEIKKSLQIFQNLNNIKMLAYAYCHLSAAYLIQGEYDFFNQYAERAIRCAEQVEINHVRADVLRQKGQYAILKGNLEQAEELFSESLQIARVFGFQADEVAAMIWISELEHRLGKMQEATIRLLDVTKRTQKKRFVEGELLAHQKLAGLFEEQKKYQQAFDHLKRFHELEKRINQEKNEMRYKSLESIYRSHTMQTEARIIEAKNEQLLKEISERKWVEEALRQSEEKFRRLANLDPLTSLNNRRYFYQLAQNEISRVNRYNHALTLLLLDIDYFKHINDRLGHLAGDQVLQWVARQLVDCLREVDIIARFGGEEYVILLPETDVFQAKSVAHRLCQFFADTQFEVRGEIIHITVSIGIAEYEKDLPLDTLIDRADRTMFAAKQAGRNRAFIWGMV